MQGPPHIIEVKDTVVWRIIVAVCGAMVSAATLPCTAMMIRNIIEGDEHMTGLIVISGLFVAAFVAGLILLGFALIPRPTRLTPRGQDTLLAVIRSYGGTVSVAEIDQATTLSAKVAEELLEGWTNKAFAERCVSDRGVGVYRFPSLEPPQTQPQGFYPHA